MKDVQAKESLQPLKREHPALKTNKKFHFYYFCGSYLHSRVRIRIHTCGSGSTTLLKQLYSCLKFSFTGYNTFQTQRYLLSFQKFYSRVRYRQLIFINLTLLRKELSVCEEQQAIISDSSYTNETGPLLYRIIYCKVPTVNDKGIGGNFPDTRKII